MTIIELTDEQAEIIRQLNDHYDFFKGILAAQPWKVKGGQVILDINTDGVLVNIGRLHPNRIEQIWRRKTQNPLAGAS